MNTAIRILMVIAFWALLGGSVYLTWTNTEHRPDWERLLLCLLVVVLYLVIVIGGMYLIAKQVASTTLKEVGIKNYINNLK